MRSSCRKPKAQFSLQLTAVLPSMRLVVLIALVVMPLKILLAEEMPLRLLIGPGSNPHLELCKKLDSSVIAERRTYPKSMCADELPIPKNNPDFAVPLWESLDPMVHMDLVKELFWREFDRDGNMSRRERDAIWEKPLISRFDNQGNIVRYPARDLIEGGKVTLGRTRFDLNFDGKIDTVYRLGLFGCRPLSNESGPHYAYSFHVVDPKDPELTRGTQSQLLRLGIGGAFWFKGRIYLVASAGDIGVYQTLAARESYGSLALQPVCAFTYRSSH